jgi:hypothetical protein
MPLPDTQKYSLYLLSSRPLCNSMLHTCIFIFATNLRYLVCGEWTADFLEPWAE